MMYFLIGQGTFDANNTSYLRKISTQNKHKLGVKE